MENGTQNTCSGQTTQVRGHSQQLDRRAEVSEAVKGPNCSRGGKGSCVERAAASKPVETHRGKLRPEEIQSLPSRQRTKHAGGLTCLYKTSGCWLGVGTAWVAAADSRRRPWRGPRRAAASATAPNMPRLELGRRGSSGRQEADCLRGASPGGAASPRPRRGRQWAAAGRGGAPGRTRASPTPGAEQPLGSSSPTRSGRE